MCRRCGEPDKRGSAKQRRARRQWLWERYAQRGWIRCVWCNYAMRKVEFEVDRYIAGTQCVNCRQSRHDCTCGNYEGGTYRRDNIIPACPPCNRARKYEAGCEQDFNQLNSVPFIKREAA